MPAVLRSASATRRHPPDAVADVIGYQQRALSVLDDGHGPPLRILLRIQKIRQHVFGLAGRPAVYERHEDDLVTAFRISIPGPVLRDKQAIAPPRTGGVTSAEDDAQLRGVRA